MTDSGTTAPRRLALVTGASSGIGYELAKQFVANDFDVIVTAEDDRIDDVARELETGGARVQAVRSDLRTYDGVEQVWAAVQADARPLAAAALNAGLGQGGAFVDIDLDDELEVIQVNVVSTVHLAKRVLRDMVDRKEGRVLVTSSIASTMPGSFQAVYNASKSFVQSWTEALQNELKDSGVTLTSLMPGATDTEFFERADMEDTKVGEASKDDPADVARMGFEALMKGEDRVVASSLKTKAQELANKVLPDKLKAESHRQMAEPTS